MSPSDLDVTMASEDYASTHVMTTEYQTSTESNGTSNGTEYYFFRDEFLAKVELAVLSIILYLAVFSNGIVLVVLKLRHHQLSRMQWFIAHLAIADLFVAFFSTLPQLIWDITIQFYGNDFVCRFIKLCQGLAMCASSYVLVMTAIDRYLSICHPLTSQTLSPSRVHQMIGLAWVLSLLLALPQVFIFRLHDMGNGEYECFGTFAPGWGLKAYLTYMFMVVYVIPCLILAFCYGRICLKVWESMAFKESSSFHQDAGIGDATRAWNEDLVASPIPVSWRKRGIETRVSAPQKISFRQAKKTKSRSPNGQKSFRLRVSFRRMQDGQDSMASHDHQTCDVTYPTNRLMTPPRKQQSAKRVKAVSTAKMRTVKMTLVVVLTYLFCWAPFFIGNLVTIYGGVDFEASYMVIIMLLASLNSCTNPWIYWLFTGRLCTTRHKKDRNVSGYNTSTHMTYASDTGMESTALQAHPNTHPDNGGGGGVVVLKDGKSNWKQLEPIKD